MKTNNYLIGNPPAGIYKGDLNIGYAFYHTILDVHARFMAKKEGIKVTSPKFSLNAFGRRADKLSDETDPKKFRHEVDSYVKNWISENRNRDQLNLSLDGLLIDNDKESVKEAKETFLKLWDGNFVVRDGDKFYLDSEKIAKERDLKGAVGEINFYPQRVKKEFERIIEENTKGLVEITKPTKYSAENPLGGENIGPLFVLSTIWEAHYNGGVDLLATSDSELAKYSLLRYLVRMATNSDPLTKGIFNYNKIDPEGGFGAWDVGQLTKDPYQADMLRYALVKSHSLTEQKKKLEKSLLKGGKNFVYLVGNIRKVFSGNGFENEKPTNHNPSENYNSSMDSFKFNESLSQVEKDFKELSKKINISRDKGSLENDLNKYYSEYVQLLNKAEPFVPAIVDLARKEI